MRLTGRNNALASRNRRRARALAPGESVADALRLTLPNARRVLVELNAPATALGVYGIRRTVTTIELGVGDPDEFLLRLGQQG